MRELVPKPKSHSQTLDTAPKTSHRAPAVVEQIHQSQNFEALKHANYRTSGMVQRVDGRISSFDPEPNGFEQITHGLDQAQLDEISNVAAQLEPYSDVEGIRSIIEGALTNVKSIAFHQMWNGVDRREDKNRIKTSFLNRLVLMTNFVKSVGEKQLNGVPIKQNYIIHSTGSDPHYNGQHALFLNPKPDTDLMPLVYKEHSLVLENGFMGSGDSIVAYANGIMTGGEEHLPTMQINTESNTEEKVPRLGSIEQPLAGVDDARPLFFQLGMLEAVAAACGMADIHGENAMFTRKGMGDQQMVGPIVIDGECGGDFSGTQINSNFGVAATDESGLMTASSLYRAHGDSYPKQILRDPNDSDFVKGRSRMEAHLIRNRGGMVRRVQERVSEVDSFRVVPIKTSNLADDLSDYVGGSRTLDALSTSRFTECEAAFGSDNWFYRPAQVALNAVNFKWAFEAALQAGTLPSFSLVLAGANAGCIELDGTVVGEIRNGDARITTAELVDRYRGRAETKINSYRGDRLAELKRAIETLPEIAALCSDASKSGVGTEFAAAIMNRLTDNLELNTGALSVLILQDLVRIARSNFDYLFFAESRSENRANEILNLPYVQELIEQFAV